jgi:hypothetical protein
MRATIPVVAVNIRLFITILRCRKAWLSHSAIFGMTCEAAGILPFDIMTGNTAFDVPLRLLRMEAATRPGPQRRKSGNEMGFWLESFLSNVPSGSMALRAEGLGFVARNTLRLPVLGIDPMGEPIVQIVNILQFQLIGRVFRRLPRFGFAHKIPSAEGLQSRSDVTILTETFGMTGLAVHVQASEPGKLTMDAPEIGSLVVLGEQRHKIQVA